MKEHMVSRMLQSRIKEAKAGTLQQAAFEQVILPLSGKRLPSCPLCSALREPSWEYAASELEKGKPKSADSHAL